MQIRADLFRRAVNVARLACDARSYVPAIAHGRLDVTSDGLATLTSTDLDTWIDVRFATGDGSDFVALLDLGALAKRLPSKGLVEFVQDGGAWWVANGPRKLRVPDKDAKDWPEFRPDTGVATEVVHYDCEPLRAALEHAHRAVSQDPSRPQIHNVLLEDTGCVVATDGHRMHWTEGLPAAPGWRVPGATVGVLLKVMRDIGVPDRVVLSGFNRTTSTDDVTMVVSGLRFDLAVGDLRVSVACKVGACEFPPWRQALSAWSVEDTQSATFDGPALLEELQAFKRAGVPEDLFSWIRLCAEGEGMLSIDSVREGLDEARSTIPSIGLLEATGVAARYLREALTLAEGTVTVTRETGKDKPLLFALGSVRHALVMPKKI